MSTVNPYDDMSNHERAEHDAAVEKGRMEQAIHTLHASLPAHSSDLELFTFAEIKQWGLKHCRKRAK